MPEGSGDRAVEQLGRLHRTDVPDAGQDDQSGPGGVRSALAGALNLAVQLPAAWPADDDAAAGQRHHGGVVGPLRLVDRLPAGSRWASRTTAHPTAGTSPARPRRPSPRRSAAWKPTATPATPRTPAVRPTVEQWVMTYLTDIAAAKVAPKTLDGYWSLARNWIIPHLGKHRLDRLQPEHLDKLYATDERRRESAVERPQDAPDLVPDAQGRPPPRKGRPKRRHAGRRSLRPRGRDRALHPG